MTTSLTHQSVGYRVEEFSRPGVTSNGKRFWAQAASSRDWEHSSFATVVLAKAWIKELRALLHKVAPDHRPRPRYRIVRVEVKEEVVK